ncbi:MAG TPA: hypothetical protein VNC18_17620 [Gemmatimonadaceae bacterium]|jgi:hypothetical protein|nr:hypothetical protein [Gemmatimonadaceae bacterium]
MSWRRFGPEWNPVLVVLSVLAIGCVLGMLRWWFGLAFVVGCVVAFLVAVWE